MRIRIRHCDHNPEAYEIYQVISGNEILDNAYQDAWDIEMSEQGDSGLGKNAFQVYLQYASPSNHSDNFKEILAVEFPDIRCSYSFQTVRGVAQWYFVPLPGFDPKHDLPVGLEREEHVFFETMLVPITTSTFNALGALLRLRDEEPICDSSEPAHKHYILKVLVHDFGAASQQPFHTVGTHTMHFVCGVVQFAWLILVLCGFTAEDNFGLSLVDGESDMFYTYGSTTKLMKVSDIVWPGAGKAVMLKPFPDAITGLH